jgi:hypothetical protein
MSEDEFWQTTPRYLFERCRAANEEKLRARYRTYAILKALGVGMDINKPSALYRFEWEEPEPTAAEMWQNIDPAVLANFENHANEQLAKMPKNGNSSRP